MKLIYFDVLVPKYLEKFYFWKLFDGSYNKFTEEEYDDDLFERRRMSEFDNPILHFMEPSFAKNQ